MRIAFVLAALMAVVTAIPTPQDIQACEKPADIVFVLDSSNSIWRPDFKTQLEFVQNVTRVFDIGPGAEQTRIGLLTFGHEVWPHFFLKDKMNRKDLMDAITAIRHGGGMTTNTGEAINFAIDRMFIPEAGNRQGVTKVMIVVTDGRSQKTHLTSAAASRAHDANINVFAIGVGKGIDKEELRHIASDPDSDFLFRVDDYRALDSITERLASRTCDATLPPTSTTTPKPTTPAPTTTTTQKQEPLQDGSTSDCGGKPADVYFIIDASGSIYKEDFEREVEFVKNVVDIFDIGQDKTRVGTMSFSDKARPLIGLNNQLSKADLIRRIGDVEHSGGGTNTAEALRTMRLHGFHASIARTDVTKVAVVLTDGLSASEEQTRREAELAHAAGIAVFAIGIGTGVDLIELKAIASNPDDDHVFQVTDFNSLDSIKETLAIKTCQVKPTDNKTQPNDGPICSAKKATDLMFVYDSAAIGAWRSNVISQFIARVVSSFDMRSGFMRVGRVTDNCPSGGNFPLSDRLTGEDFAQIHFATFTHLLKKVKRTGFTFENGAQTGSSKVTIMFLDSDMDSIDHDTLKEIKHLGRSVDIYMVAIGNNPAISDVVRLIGGNRVIRVESYESLPNAHALLVNKLCLFFELDPFDYDIDYVVPK